MSLCRRQRRRNSADVCRTIFLGEIYCVRHGSFATHFALGVLCGNDMALRKRHANMFMKTYYVTAPCAFVCVFVCCASENGGLSDKCWLERSERNMAASGLHSICCTYGMMLRYVCDALTTHLRCRQRFFCVVFGCIVNFVCPPPLAQTSALTRFSHRWHRRRHRRFSSCIVVTCTRIMHARA